ncbi:unnamed protein product [Dicrocoelium dendriticum]|nr:unnamed protein product [Dicrocoelium dendriticum]
MSSLFESYEKQYGNLTSEITLNLGRIPLLENGDRQKLVRDTSILFDEIRDLFEQMSLEIQELAHPTKDKCLTMLECFKAEHEKLKTEFQRPRYAPHAKTQSKNLPLDDDEGLREEVLYDSDMRARLLDNTERIARSTNRLEDGVRVALQTEEIGSHILSDLGEQREKLQRSRNRLRQADADLTKSSRILTQMTRRIFQNRIVLMGTILLLILIFVVTIYLTVRQPSSSVTPAAVMPLPEASAVKSNSNAAGDNSVVGAEHSRSKRSLLLAGMLFT